MSSKAQGKRTTKKRSEVPVTSGIRRAAERAGIIDPCRENATLAIAQLTEAMQLVLDAEDAPVGGERDVLVLSAFRNIRNVQNILTAALDARGAA